MTRASRLSGFRVLIIHATHGNGGDAAADADRGVDRFGSQQRARGRSCSRGHRAGPLRQYVDDPVAGQAAPPVRVLIVGLDAEPPWSACPGPQHRVVGARRLLPRSSGGSVLGCGHRLGDLHPGVKDGFVGYGFHAGSASTTTAPRFGVGPGSSRPCLARVSGRDE